MWCGRGCSYARPPVAILTRRVCRERLLVHEGVRARPDGADSQINDDRPISQPSTKARCNNLAKKGAHLACGPRCIIYNRPPQARALSASYVLEMPRTVFPRLNASPNTCSHPHYGQIVATHAHAPESTLASTTHIAQTPYYARLAESHHHPTPLERLCDCV